MKIQQLEYRDNSWLPFGNDTVSKPQLCLVFGSRLTLEQNLDFSAQLKRMHPSAEIVSTSGAGNILDENLSDNSITATFIEFEKTRIKPFSFKYNGEDDFEFGKLVANKVNAPDLAYILVFCTSGVNAGNILKGLNAVIEGKSPISGGVAGDDFRFEKTLVGLNENINSNHLVAVGFYGSNLETKHGSRGGWDFFGPTRKVTKSVGNKVFEIDNKPALELYKRYLGDRADGLPLAGLHFPLAIINQETGDHIVRGLQDIDEEMNALILFADVNEGDTVQLMKANFNRVIDGSSESAKEASFANHGGEELAILISCVARRLVLDQLTEEELSEAKRSLSKNTKMCGFYSYSEMSPIVGDNACHLHNQTMTITTIREK